MPEPPAPFHFDADYREELLLRDGTPIELRLIRATDKDNLRDGFARMSPASRYLRFFTFKPRLPAGELSYLTEVDGVDHFALVAGRRQDDAREEGLGVARFIRLKDTPDVAEAAIAVVDELHGRGLGTLLLRRLSSAAYERGIRWFACDFLSENRGIRELLRGLSPALEVQSQGGSVLRARVEVPNAAPNERVAGTTPDDAIHRFFAHAAAGLLRVRQHLRDSQAEPGAKN